MSQNRPASRYLVVGIVAFLIPIVFGFAILFTILSKRSGIKDLDPRVRHFVSDRMVSDTERRAKQPAPDFTLPVCWPKGNSLSATTASLKQLDEHSPVLLYFINTECPCSVDAEPMFNAFSTAYPDLKVIGITNADLKASAKWAEQNRPNHIILSDPKLGSMKAYGAISSVYTAIITQSGKIVKMWPGYSQSMMDEVTKIVSDLSGKPAVKLDRKLSPEDMAAGCAFELTH